MLSVEYRGGRGTTLYELYIWLKSLAFEWLWSEKNFGLKYLKRMFFNLFKDNKGSHKTKCRKTMIASTINSAWLYVFTVIILTKSSCFVRSGIRIHAYKSKLQTERSALDRSAILTDT